ncbi:MAG: aldehyde dehydrogenase family protein [Firmicutes bacterium]|nr:aldehyde dehydrogenase family protein [Bacillota bacterium]
MPAVRDFIRNGPKRLFIGGKWVESQEGKTFDDIDPATGEGLAQVYEAKEADVDRAVAAARRAFEGTWSSLTSGERGKLLWKLADLMEAHQLELAQLESLDTGKPINEAMIGDIPQAINHFRYFAGWAGKVTGETLTPYGPSLPGEYLAFTRREPLGVVGAIVPWNFPLMITSWKVAPALACGNTVVLKPSEMTPLTALRLAELTQEAGFPPGVFNVLPGFGQPAGAALADHMGVDKISFTGSVVVGRSVMQAAAQSNFKRVTLELGGKSPNIVFPDADLDAAISGVMMGIFFNQGEVCCAGSRLFLPKSQFESMLQGLADRAKQIRQGPGISPMTTMGPLISEKQMNRVLQYIETGKQEGAQVVCGGDRNEAAGPGYFVQPTILLGEDRMTVSQEEIFGPVLVALPYETFDEVIQRANDTPYGLAAGIWSRDIKTALKAAHRIKAGTVWVNGYNVLDASSPWGGFKQTGVGREMGSYALEHYTEVKSVWVNLT